MPDWVLIKLFSTPVPWSLHLNFSSKMIKQNLERQNGRRMHEKCLEAFVDFWVFFFIFIFPMTEEKWLHDVLIFMPYLENRFVWWTYSFMNWFLWRVINTPLFMFIWTMVNSVLAYFQFGQQIPHWICYFLAFVLFPAIFVFYTSRWRDFTLPCFIYLPDCVLNSSFSTPVSRDLQLNKN